MRRKTGWPKALALILGILGIHVLAFAGGVGGDGGGHGQGGTVLHLDGTAGEPGEAGTGGNGLYGGPGGEAALGGYPGAGIAHSTGDNVSCEVEATDGSEPLESDPGQDASQSGPNGGGGGGGGSGGGGGGYADASCGADTIAPACDTHA